MITALRITNFHSIGDTQEILFKVKKKDILNDSCRLIGDEIPLNLVNCIIGHNASGKTTVLKAITFILWFANVSYYRKTDKIPLEPHKLKPQQPTKIEIEFFYKDTIYSYRLVATKDEVLGEFFGKKVLRGFTRIFEYQRVGDSWDFKSSGLQINPNDLRRFEERKQNSVLSALIQLEYLPDFNYFDNTYTNVYRYGLSQRKSSVQELSNALSSDKALRDSILYFCREIDLGVVDFAFRDIVMENKSASGDETQQVLELIHKSNVGHFQLDMVEESNGTQLSIYQVSKLIPILSTGGIVVIDEIESGLHPYVAKKLISLFENKHTNPNNAQLFFSTHQHWLLNDRTKTQIFIAEKNYENFETEVFNLDEIEGIRNDENYFIKYMTGAYGGTGNINFF